VYSPNNTRAVPADISPMLRGAPAFPVRCRVRLSPITRKPAKVEMFMPNRMSLVSTAPYPIDLDQLRSSSDTSIASRTLNTPGCHYPTGLVRRLKSSR
jgi:hypothetical protein